MTRFVAALTVWVLSAALAHAQEDGASLDAPPVLSPMQRLEARITAEHWDRCAAGDSQPIQILVVRNARGRVSVLEAPEGPRARCLAAALDGAMVPAEGLRSGARNLLVFPLALDDRFDASLVVQAIRRRLRPIQVCYEQQLRQNPRVAGKVTVKLTLEERGAVTNAEALENTTGSDAMARCVLDEILRLPFPHFPVGDDVDFSYPFVFAPQS